MSWGELYSFQSRDKISTEASCFMKHSVGHWDGKTKEDGLFLNFTPGYILNRNENKCPHKTCAEMFIAASFITVKRWKQPEYPSMDKG